MGKGRVVFQRMMIQPSIAYIHEFKDEKMERHNIKGISSPQSEEPSQAIDLVQQIGKGHAAVNAKEGQEKELPAIADTTHGNIDVELPGIDQKAQKKGAGQGDIPCQKAPELGKLSF